MCLELIESGTKRKRKEKEKGPSNDYMSNTCSISYIHAQQAIQANIGMHFPYNSKFYIDNVQIWFTYKIHIH